MYGEKEEFNTNIHGLIVKWEELGGEGSSKEEGGGGGLTSRRKSSEFIRRLSLFEDDQEANNPRGVQTSFSNLSHFSNCSNIVSERKIILQSLREGPYWLRDGPM